MGNISSIYEITLSKAKRKIICKNCNVKRWYFIQNVFKLRVEVDENEVSEKLVKEFMLKKEQNGSPRSPDSDR